MNGGKQFPELRERGISGKIKCYEQNTLQKLVTLISFYILVTEMSDMTGCSPLTLVRVSCPKPCVFVIVNLVLS